MPPANAERAATDGPFGGAGQALRTGPFLAALCLGLLLALVQGLGAVAPFALAAALVLGSWLAIAVLPWERLPRGAQLAPPLAWVPVAPLLGEAAGGAGGAFAPLAAVPVLWLALHGTRRELVLTLAAAVLAVAIPLLASDPTTSELTRALLVVAVATLIGMQGQTLVGRIRRGADAGEALRVAVLQSALDSVITMDHRGCVLEINPAAERTFGYSHEEAAGRELAELIVPPALREAHRQGLARYVETGEPRLLDRRVELTAIRRDGRELPVELTVTRIAGTEPPRFAGYLRDLTARRHAARAIAAQHAVALALAESATVDAATPALLRALGESMDWDLGAAWLLDEGAETMSCQSVWSRETVAADEFNALSAQLRIARGSGPLGRAWESGEPSSTESAPGEPDYPRAEAVARAGLQGGLWIPIRSGREVLGVLEFYSREPHPLDDPLLRTLSTVGAQIGQFFRRRGAEERLAHRAIHDDLTGLPNRGLLIDRLTHALERSRRTDARVAVLFLDVDDFKRVNDSLGHHVGDELLKAVAARLARAGADTAARFGGDEFVVLLEDIADEEGAIEVAERVVHELGRPVALGGHELPARASIGVALGTGAGATADSLLRDADAAMHSAKAQARGRYELFDQAMRSRLLDRVAAESELRHALVREQLQVYYQPIVSLADGAVQGVEALLRWQHPERGLVPPGGFIPLAEESGLIVPIGRWVISEACRQCEEWRRELPAVAGLRVSVNLSARQLSDPELVDALAVTLRETGIAPGRLSLEITESVLVEDVETATATLRSLKALGVHLELDDFGTGYSSLSYLKRFPLDALKLDRSFVSGLGSSPEELAIASAVIEMARALGMAVIAEGVENGEQLGCLRSLECPFVQGFYFARPMPAAAATEFLRAGPQRMLSTRRFRGAPAG